MNLKHYIAQQVKADVEQSIVGLPWITAKNRDLVVDTITLIYMQDSLLEKQAIIMSVKAVDKPLSALIAMHYAAFCRRIIKIRFILHHLIEDDGDNTNSNNDNEKEHIQRPLQ